MSAFHVNLIRAERDDLLKENAKLKADLKYFTESLASNKRPFSDKFSADTIASQLETIKRLESIIAEHDRGYNAGKNS